MKLNLTDLLYILSQSLDMVEHDMIGVQSAHGKHVAYLTLLMARNFGYSGDELRELVGCAMLHDNAFSEYASEEFYGGSAVDVTELRKRVDMLSGDEYMDFISGCLHSEAGEENIRLLPFRTDVRGIILYHHENADGTGPMGLNSSQTPFKSQIVHLADAVDVTWNLLTLTEEEFQEMRGYIADCAGTFFSVRSADLFLNTVTYDDIMRLQDSGTEPLLRHGISSGCTEYTAEEVRNIARFFARIVDCKSSFVRNHSIGVAQKAEKIARHLGMSEEKCLKIFLAGALHDIGKLLIQKDILEKPGKLTEQEFSYVKNHAAATYEILRRISDFEDVTRWASRHHEKLNGSGYPLGLTAEELSVEDRLMTCSDIYQALTEKRPYKDAYSHEKAMEIMRKMAENGEIDPDITSAMDSIFGGEC